MKHYQELVALELENSETIKKINNLSYPTLIKPNKRKTILLFILFYFPGKAYLKKIKEQNDASKSSYKKEMDDLKLKLKDIAAKARSLCFE